MRARRVPRRRGPRSTRAIVAALALLTATVSVLVAAGGRAALATPKPASLQQRLERLNAQSDRVGEQYLEAKAALGQLTTQTARLGRQAAVAGAQLARLRAALSSQAASTYMAGPGGGLTGVLGATDPADALQRAEMLDFLAQHNGDLYQDVDVVASTYAKRRAVLDAVQREQAAKVARLKAEAAQLNKLVLQTGPLLAQLRRADPTNPLLPTANGADRPGGPVVLPASWGTGRAWAAIRYAYAQLGKPYVWGATGPAAFDCSGLTLMAWAQAGIALPHFAAAQFAIGRPVTRSELQPGDLIFRNSPISHVAIYVGSGLQIAATHTGSTVKLQAAFSGDIVGYTRPDG